MKAWQDPIGTIRDVCHGNPAESYHPDIAKLYDTDVPKTTVNGATLVEGVWVNPAPPAQPTAEELTAAAQAAAEANRLAGIPQSVTMRQARLALLGSGQLATVNSAIADMAGPNGDAARIKWEFSTEVGRDQTLVLAMGKVLGMTALQLDDLFTAAAAL